MTLIATIMNIMGNRATAGTWLSGVGRQARAPANNRTPREK